jgi:hypothetical protein
VEKLRSYDKILTENVDIRLKLKAAELEREQYKVDIAKVIYVCPAYTACVFVKIIAVCLFCSRCSILPLLSAVIM